jgi:acetyl-CoA acetyltransferase family protein
MIGPDSAHARLGDPGTSYRGDVAGAPKRERRGDSLTRVADAFIVDAVRSPIGRRNGSLATVRADDLAAEALNGLLGRVDLDPAEVEDVQMGCVTQIGEQALNIGRIAALVAGWPETVAATTVDRQCGSSMQAAFNGSAAIQAGHLDVVVAAGVESMSRVPMLSNLGPEGFAGLHEKIAIRWPIVPQGISAEEIAREWNLSREQLDAYALESHRRALAAIDEGRFEGEIVPIPLEDGGVFAVDEAPRRDTSPERLASLNPAFRGDGVVTAGNASQIVDGSAAMLLASEAAVARLGLMPRARFVSFGIAGVDPYRMLHGNPQACAQALRRAGLGWDDMAVIEINEAFASVVLQTLADTGLDERWAAGDVNPNGGGISLGHPLGATGARITATLLAELDRREARYGLACMCIGQGQAIAAIVERLAR